MRAERLKIPCSIKKSELLQNFLSETKGPGLPASFGVIRGRPNAPCRQTDTFSKLFRLRRYVEIYKFL